MTPERTRLNRRQFISSTVVPIAAAVPTSNPLFDRSVPRCKHRFSLNYAPHFGAFQHLAGPDPVAQIQFMADQGFAAVEDHRLLQRPESEQEAIARMLARHGMTMGAFSATAEYRWPTFASGEAVQAARVLAEIRAVADFARRISLNWCTVVPGKLDPHLPRLRQTANCIGLLRRCAEVCQPVGLVLLLEPLGLPSGGRAPRLFLDDLHQTREICREVASPACRILFDVARQYRRQAGTTELIREIDRCGSEIGYVQVGDCPGRKEPGTGEIDFRAVFRHLRDRSYTGVVGMEHGNSQPGRSGEWSVVEAYQKSDPR